MSLKVNAINDSRDLEYMVPQWNELLGRDTDASPFQLPEWLLLWWRYFGNDELWALQFMEGRDLAGLALLFTYSDDNKKKLCFVGSGITDYLDFIAVKECKKSAGEYIMRYVCENVDWDICDLQELKNSSFLYGFRAFSDFNQQLSIQNVCPYMRLPEIGMELYKTVPKHHEKNIRNALNRIRKLGNESFELADEQNFSEFMKDLVRLHTSRWQSLDMPGVIAEENIQQFYMESGRALLKRGALDLGRLRVGGRTCAVYLTLTFHGSTCAYLGGIDPEFEFCSPGVLGLYYCMKAAMARGSREFDFLRGNEKYKYHWGVKERFNYRLQLERRS